MNIHMATQDIESRRKRIEEILLSYVALDSFTNSREKCVEVFFEDYFGGIEYFREHPEMCGLYPIPNDHLERRVPWCLFRGHGTKTVVLVHHCDVVDTGDYGILEPLALKPHEVTQAFRESRMELDPDVFDEAIGGEWLFGRGVGDMKGGAAIQLALLEEYCRQKDFCGNILLIAVPDEENLSAGMMGAVQLLKELDVKYELDYRLMIDCEPHDRENKNCPTIYNGSIGKVMPVFYVRGKLAHVGHVYDGLNPVSVLSEIVRRTELNSEFIERVGSTTSPPPAYLACRDRKIGYDVSLPPSASGCLSLLPLQHTPQQILIRLRTIAQQAFDAVIADANASFRHYCSMADIPWVPLPWTSRVVFFEELYQEALCNAGEIFAKAYHLLSEELAAKFHRNECNAIDCTNTLIENVLAYIKDLSPVVVIALAPPFYPSVHNSMLAEDKAQQAEEVRQAVMEYSRRVFDEKMASQDYYVAISDLSYACYTEADETIGFIGRNMPAWGDIYFIPLETVGEISMPVLNIGPWGKDLHKYIERVYVPDLYYKTPQLVDLAIREILRAD